MQKDQSNLQREKLDGLVEGAGYNHVSFHGATMIGFHIRGMLDDDYDDVWKSPIIQDPEPR